MADQDLESMVDDNSRAEITIATHRTPTATSRAIALHGEVFKTDPVLNFQLCHMPIEERQAYIPIYMAALMKSASLNSADFDEAVFEDSSSPSSPTVSSNENDTHPKGEDTLQKPLVCSAVWMPPNCRVDNWRTYYASGIIGVMIHVGIRAIRRVLGDYVTRADAAKKKALFQPDANGKLRQVDYWYLFFISTDAAARGKGVGAKVIQRMQDKLRKEAEKSGGKGQPIWLEATTEGSRRLYLRLGFQEIDNWVLGKGEVDKTGGRSEGGEGVPVWGMVWWPA